MKYIKTYEDRVPWFDNYIESDNIEIKIGDEVICVSGEGILEYGRTYIIDDIKGNYWKQFKIKGLDYWYDWDRFKNRSKMDPGEVDYYDTIVAKEDANKYNL